MNAVDSQKLWLKAILYIISTRKRIKTQMYPSLGTP